jgi:ubiquinone/menaquinone biosynthesis C-methylase UbiE
MKYFDKKNNRLVFEEKRATVEFWDNLWNISDFKNTILSGKNDFFVSRYTKKYIRPEKNKKILEGGCGKGNFVYSLSIKGYDSYGVDYAKETVKHINAVMPELNISSGNVECLNFSENFFDGYWSLGVIEHFFDGYGKISSEMKRVIKPGGYLFITFPYMSPIRKLKTKFNSYPKFEENKFNKENFYQFALDYKKVKSDLEKLGFKLIFKKPFDGIKGLKDEVRFIRYPLRQIYNSKKILLRILSAIISRLFSPFSSHCILLIFQKS